MTNSQGTPSEPARLRREFVSMLFALAVGQVAIYSFCVMVAVDGGNPGWRWAAIAHLGLALLVIASSWIGWSKSTSTVHEVDRVFDIDFIPWILDILLVFIYFFLASSAEIIGTFDDRKFTLTAPTAIPELKWTLWLMILYLAWDVFSKCTKRLSVCLWLMHSLVCIVASSLTVLLLLALQWYVHRYVEASGSPPPSWDDVVAVDVALLGLVVLFRVLKSVEATSFIVRHRRLRTNENPPKTEPLWVVKIIGLLVVVIACCAWTRMN